MWLSVEAVCMGCEELDEEFVRIRDKYRTAARLAGLSSPEAKRMMELENGETFRLISRMLDHKASDH
jgi:hypothetical protein